MAPISAILELMDNLILSTMDNTVKTIKSFPTNIHSCLQDVHKKIDFLPLESQLQREELEQRNHHSEPVSVQKIETDSHKTTRLHADVEVQLALPKHIIRPWEELVHNKKITSLGYDKDVSFHILDYTKPIIF